MPLPPVNTNLPQAPGQYDAANEQQHRRMVQTALQRLRPTDPLASALSNLSATTDPAVTNDASAGYSVGSVWINTATPVVYDCTDATAGAAVWTARAGGGGGSVSSVFTRTGAVTATSGDYTVSEVTGAAPLANPTFTGTPAAPTASAGTNTTQLATTAFVNQGWPYVGDVPSVTTVSSVPYTVLDTDVFLLITTASTYPTMLLPAASVPRYLKMCWAHGTWGVANTSQAQLTPNGSDTICGVSGTGKAVMARGYDTCEVWTTGNGNWQVTFPSYALVNFASGQVFPGNVTFTGAVQCNSTASFENQPKSWGGVGARATLESLARCWGYTPSGSGDTAGVGSDLTYDTNFLYLNTGTTQATGGNWSRVPLGFFTAVDLATQGAAITATTLYAVPSTGAGLYRVSWSAVVTQAATASSVLGGAGGFQVTYTDTDTGAATTPLAIPNAVATGNTVGTQLSGDVVVNAKASTNIQYAFGYTSSGLTVMQYALHIRLEFLG